MRFGSREKVGLWCRIVEASSQEVMTPPADDSRDVTFACAHLRVESVSAICPCCDAETEFYVTEQAPGDDMKVADSERFFLCEICSAPLDAGWNTWPVAEGNADG